MSFWAFTFSKMKTPRELRGLEPYGGCGMQIDNEPNQPSHRAIKIAAILAAVVTLASWSPLRTGPARWVVDQFPIESIMFLAGALMAGPICFFIGRRDALRAFRPSKPTIDRSRDDFPAILKYAAHILISAPFAVFLLPIRGWKRARANGEGIFFSFINCLLGSTLGLMVTLATFLLVAIPIQIAFEGG
ncbi:hypothetical protein [Rhizobium leguminosarum]|uniref:hypothetical protein n=1 Tax=Rhizobium leguminosarum TaxID=384 RepID=UPI0004208FE3|nr:hypothetical protein [Rhizobium leguminosarum]